MASFVVCEVPAAETRALRQQVLRPHESREQVAASEPDQVHAVGAYARDRLIAVGLIGTEEDPRIWRVRGMATDPRARGQGAGSAVLDALIQHATQRGATTVWCNARTPARSLYERAGFRATSDEFGLPDIGPHFRMELSIQAGRGGDG